MKKVLLIVSLLANVALVGALIYTIAERNSLDRQRESLAISNEQYQKKLEGSSSPNSTETKKTATSVSNHSMDNSAVEGTVSSTNSEGSSQEATGTSKAIELFSQNYYFDGFNGTITSREGELSHMSEHFTRSPITVTDSSGTYNADLYTNHDGTAQITDSNGNTLYSGTVKPTKELEILSLKSSLQNSSRNDLVTSLPQRSWNDPEVANLAQKTLENASDQNISDEQWQQLSNDIIKQLETMDKGN
ncbi:hypothetical protein ACFC4I_05245 [Enterococcus durans]|uniref:hypothetical protein n=1 Tax=Enterococcus durans TaxID=53345 RepID=UPI0035DDF9F9